MSAVTAKVNDILRQPKPGAPWCSNNENFNSGTEGSLGVLDISPTWFQQGHDVCSVCHARFPSEGVIMWRPERFCGNWTVVDAGDALVGYPWRGRERMETSTGDN
jgi:hypothetical protein